MTLRTLAQPREDMGYKRKGLARGLGQTGKALSWGGSPRDLLRQQDKQRRHTHRQSLQFLWIINSTQGRNSKTEPR